MTSFNNNDLIILSIRRLCLFIGITIGLIGLLGIFLGGMAIYNGVMDINGSGYHPFILILISVSLMFSALLPLFLAELIGLFMNIGMNIELIARNSEEIIALIQEQ
jgi:hypothetical protein